MIVEILTSAILPGMRQRSIGKMFFLFIVTFGFYRLYWLAKTRTELQEKTKLNIPSIWILLVPYILVIFSVGMMIASGLSSSTYDSTCSMTEDRTCGQLCPGYSNYSNNCEDPTVSEEDMDGLAVGGLVLMYASLLVIFPLMGWWYWKYAQAVEKVTHEKLSFPVTMLIMLAVPDIFDMLIVQDSFNKLGKSKPAKA